MTNTTAPNGKRKRTARGPQRPRYLANRDLDRMMIMFVALMGEVSSLRDRLDTHEALADGGQTNTTAAVESFKLNDDRLAARDRLRADMLKRVFRVLTEEREGAKSGTDRKE